MTQNGQKWPKNRVFGLFKKIKSLVFSGIFVKRKFLWLISILRKLHAWKKSGFQVIAENFSWPMRFQYYLIVNNSLIDFDSWHVDRHERKKQGSLTGFLKKNYHLEEWAILGPKFARPHNSGIFLKFCTMKGANR